MPSAMARLRSMLPIKMYCSIFILCYNLGMIEHLRNGSIVKVTPTDCRTSYYIVRVTEIFNDHSNAAAKGIVGVYKTCCAGEFLKSTVVGGYPAPDMSGAFLESTNSFEVLSY
tara:strand:- start:1945 stop:2283 length:339 start_codon:yes stop_codon:yes gene_type:complete